MYTDKIQVKLHLKRTADHEANSVVTLPRFDEPRSSAGRFCRVILRLRIRKHYLDYCKSPIIDHVLLHLSNRVSYRLRLYVENFDQGIRERLSHCRIHING